MPIPQTFVPSQDNSVITVRFTQPDCVYDFATEPTNGLHPFKPSDMTTEEFDAQESYPVDAVFFNIVDNNASAFNSMKS